MLEPRSQNLLVRITVGDDADDGDGADDGANDGDGWAPWFAEPGRVWTMAS